MPFDPCLWTGLRLISDWSGTRVISELSLGHRLLEVSEATQAVQDVAILASIAYSMRDNIFLGGP
jgi:hypothetical protein